MNRPGKTDGMHHIALKVRELESTEHFYTELVGMAVEWRPDADNVYLTNGNDNLALHRIQGEAAPGRLDHIGFFINDIGKVDLWYEYLLEQGVKMLMAPKTHRDGARSFYCEDPDGTRVQFIHYQPIAASDQLSKGR